MQDVCIFYDLIAFFLVRLNAAQHLLPPPPTFKKVGCQKRPYHILKLTVVTTACVHLQTLLLPAGAGVFSQLALLNAD